MEKYLLSNGKQAHSGFIPVTETVIPSGKSMLNPRLRGLMLLVLLVMPMLLSATLYLPAIPSNQALAKRFERSTEMAFRVKVGNTFLPSGALIAYINNEIRGAQTASVLFPPTGEMIYKILVFNDAASGDSISFRYYDIFSEKIYEIKEKIEFIPDLVPDYSNPAILTAYCKPVLPAGGLLPENNKDNQNATLDLYWQPSSNTAYYNLFLWETGAAVPATPYYANINNTSARVYNLTYGKSYSWKIVSVNDCSTAESAVQTFKVRQLPDLVVTSVQSPATVESGNNFTVTFTIKNTGPGSTFGAQWKDAVYVSADGLLSADDKLLTTVTNPGQLAPDSSYTQSVSVMLPIDYAGQYYLFVKTDGDNSVQEISDLNNTLKATNAVTVSLKPLPDILVKNIQPQTASIAPGDSLLINWQVENAGTVPASGGWSERITLVPDNGTPLVLTPNSNYTSDLAAKSTISRSVKFKIPEITRFTGNAKIKIELIPSATLVQQPSALVNDMAISTASVNVVNVLVLSIQTRSILENSTDAVRCILSRSGDFTSALGVDISASQSGQVTLPASVIIPSNSSSVVFNLNALNNNVLDGNRMIGIKAHTALYRDAVDSIQILDDEVPSLSLQLDKTSYTEGDVASLTVSRDFVTNKPLVVSLSTNKSNQWTFPQTVTIPASQASGIVTVSITDDQIPELNSSATLNASAAGFTSGQASAIIIDNDVPQVKFEILTDTISESAGIYATWGRITRISGSDNVTINLTANTPDALFFPASVSLPKGAAETKFNIGVVDNTQVDGFRTIVLKGAIFISSCGCNTSAENGGIVQAKLVIADNDGPTLTATVDPVSLMEGQIAAGKLIITRNTSTDNPLVVSIKFNDPTEVDIQSSATIPAGKKSVEVPINTINDHIDDGDQMVTIQANAPSFSPGLCYVFVTDQNKPDLSLRPIRVSADTANVGGLVDIQGIMRNTGYLDAPQGVKIGFYLSSDDMVDNNDQLLGQFETPATLAAGDSIKFAKAVTLPNSTGNYKIIAQANPGNVVNELVYTNNTSIPVPIVILPDYNARAVVDNDFYMPNTPITIHGNAFRKNNQPVGNVDVDVYVLSNGTRRELKAKTNSNGDYSIEFTPVLNETGHLTVGACYPKQNLSVNQDAFDILGLQKNPLGNIIWEMKLGQTLTGTIGITNQSLTALHHVAIQPTQLPAGCQLTIDTIALLPGGETKSLNFTLKAIALSPGKDYEKITFKASASEGVSTTFNAFFYSQALQGQLKSDPVSINTTITKGKSRLYEIHVYNNGAGETGNVTISLPDLGWMTLMSPAVIDNIRPGDTAVVVLQMTPGADMLLNTPVTGNIAMNCVNGIGLSLPFKVEAVSEALGSLKVDVVDEYTYFTETKPHLKNAHVVVRHPYSGQVFADGFTDSTGVFRVESLPEGTYKLTVEADKHEGYQNTITIDPGRVNEQNIFLSFQAISYTWEVVPTQIEDNYSVELVMKYETNVPVPVVVMEMPTDMPQLVNNETYPFLITLTNKGLITAKDVQLQLPQNDPEYEFITNFTKLDLLAQQAIQIPVVMKRRDTPKSPVSTESSGPCTDYSYTIYGWECGPDHHWGQSSHSITFTGRVCESSGGSIGNWTYYPYGGGDPSRGGGGTYYYYGPGSSTPSVVTPTTNCEPCLISLGLNAIGCFPVLGPVITNGAGILSCLISLADFDVSFLDFSDCAMTAIGLVVDLAEIGCVYGLLRSAYDCYKDPPIFVKSPLTALPKAATGGGTKLMPPILKQSMQDLAFSLSVYQALDSLNTELMGRWDWISKASLKDFTAQVEPFVKQNKTFGPADIATIEQNMAGKDISTPEILLFTTRWNNSMEAWSHKVYSPNAQYPDIIDKVKLKESIMRIDTAQKYAVSRGYANPLEMHNDALATTKDEIDGGKNSVCSSVSIKIEQKLVMTREAFEGTLTIYNGNKTTAMTEVKLNLEIKDENGILSNDLFQIDTKALDILTGIDGTGQLGPDQKGSATVLFIPEKGAAPTVPKYYSFGGSFSYRDPFTDEIVTKPLFPVTLAVNPSPDLYLHYFMQRDILGDDPLTAEVEPIVPGELALMIQNNGYGTANGVRVESAQPKIVDNQKGLAINFALVASNFNGQPRQLGVTNIDFGNIAPKSTAIGQWWFTCDLLGHFVNYDAKVTHLDSRGNPDLSLISGATMHELIHSIRVYGGQDDGIDDFLVNEVQDAKETPDAIYLSNSGVLDVYPASEITALGSLTAPSFEIDIQVTPAQIGWNYGKMRDPGAGLYKLMSVTREDGQVIPMSNFWQTFVTLPDGKDPVYENNLHMTDIFNAVGPVKYHLRYAPKVQAQPEIVRIDSVPDKFIVKPLTSVTVVFNKPIDPATFTYEDMTLRLQGGPDLMDPSVTITQIDPVTFRVNLAPKTVGDGFYVLNIQTNAISDLTGTFGEKGKQASWTQFAHIPAVAAFIGMPGDSTSGAPVDFIMLKFNVPIDRATFWPDQLIWEKDGNLVSGNVTITAMDVESKLFKVSGLLPFLSADGKYTLTVDLPKISSLEGVNGVVTQSTAWAIDQTPPVVSNITLKKVGGYDSQHVTAVEVQFSEPVTGFSVSSLELWKDGQRQPLSQLDITKVSDRTYNLTQFRLLTYYDGNYTLKVKLSGISDLSGNVASGIVEKKWLVLRKPPKAVTDLHITPDMGFSATDAVTASGTVTAVMNVTEPNSTIRIYQNDIGNITLLAEVTHAQPGLLSVPIQFTRSGNLVLEAHCLDSLTNEIVTQLNVFIDEAALQANWKNLPAAPITAQVDSLVLEFSDKLLDDAGLKGFLKFDRDGLALNMANFTISKSSDKAYILKGIKQAGSEAGQYTISVDLTKLQKYSSGKPGLALSKAQWSVKQTNRAPVAFAGYEGKERTVNERDWVTLDGTFSYDPDNDPLTFAWTSPAGITLSSTIVSKPTFIAPDVTSDTDFVFYLVVNDGTINSVPASITIHVKDVFVSLPAGETKFFKVYPNPTTGIFTVELQGNQNSTAEISVINMTGAEILHKIVGSGTRFQVDLSNQVSGIYLVKVTDNKQQHLGKIILRKD